MRFWGGFVLFLVPTGEVLGVCSALAPTGEVLADLLCLGCHGRARVTVRAVPRYFTLFMNLLNDCSEAEEDGAAAGGRKRGMSRRLASLRHCTVLAMSNLLNANVDSGLMHSIGNPRTAPPVPHAPAPSERCCLLSTRPGLSQGPPDQSHVHGSAHQNPAAGDRV